MSQTNADIPANFPVAANPEEAEMQLDNFVPMGSFTNIQRALLMAIVTDCFAERPRTQAQMAEDLGIARSTINFNLANTKFNTALGLMMVAVTRGKTHKYLRQMEQLGDKGDYRALKFMIEYGGTYVKKTSVTSRSMNINVNAGNMQSPETFDQAFDSFLIMCGERGVSVEKITERYLQLRREHAW